MEITSNSTMGFDVYLKLTESEARALDALVGYGHKAFLEVFYKHMGECYMKPNEKGLISLFESVRDKVPAHLSRIDKTRKTFQENNPNRDQKE